MLVGVSTLLLLNCKNSEENKKRKITFRKCVNEKYYLEYTNIFILELINSHGFDFYSEFLKRVDK